MTGEAIYNEVKTRLEDAVQDIFIEMQDKLGITSGDVSPEYGFQLEIDTRMLAKMIQLTLEQQKED